LRQTQIAIGENRLKFFNSFYRSLVRPSTLTMNKRLLVVYVTVFLLIGLMLYLYRLSYNAMKVYINDGRSINTVLIKMERLNALLHFWLFNTSPQPANNESYIPSHAAYDSVLVRIENLKELVVYQEQRLRLDSMKRLVKDYQSNFERSDSLFAAAERNAYQKRLMKLATNTTEFSLRQLEDRKNSLDDATALLDRWLVWMLVFAAFLTILATFYSFSFLYQQRRAEGFSRTLLETTTYGIVSVKPVYLDGGKTDYIITYCNEAAAKILRIRNWRDKLVSRILPKTIVTDVIKTFRQVIFSKHNRTIEGYVEFGSERTWISATVAPLEEGVLVSIYDLNPMKAYEQRLTYQIKQLELTNDELQQYAYVTSHDLQEPLRKIQMFGDMALNIKADQTKSKDDYIQKIINSAGHMRELIQTLLLFTRSTNQPSSFEPVDLGEVVKKVMVEMEDAIAEKNVRINLSRLPVIAASEVHMNLLFTNIISNGIKYSRPDVPPSIDIMAEPVAVDEFQRFPALDQTIRYTKVLVRDNGVGFNPGLAEKIFTIFQRLHNKENTPGAGIGLAICRKIVHQHHGFIYAEAMENQGASFYIFLPLDQPS
jgi:signal transduction histidine kinase